MSNKTMQLGFGEMGLGLTAKPAKNVLPTITGTLTLASTLTAVPGIWDNHPVSFTYQWLRDGSNIADATSVTYVVAEADVGHNLSVRITATNAVGSTVALSRLVTIFE